MVALRRRPLAALSGPFWLSAFCAAYSPTAVGYQDLSGFLAQQAGVPERSHEHLIASPFGTIHAATFNFSRPIGTAMSAPLGAQPVNFDPRALDVKVWLADEPPMARPGLHVQYPTVNREHKSDRLPVPQSSPAASEPETLPVLQPITAPGSQPAIPPAPTITPRPKSAEQIAPGPEVANDAFGSLPNAGTRNAQAANTVTPAAAPSGARAEPSNADADDDVSLADRPPEIPAAGDNDPADTAPSSFASLSFMDDDAAERDTRLFFGVGSTAGSGAALEQWSPGAEPILVSPAAVDPDIKLSALEGAANAGAANAGAAGETLAAKNDAHRLEAPAERLGLSGKPRAKAEKCLADAVYFEARGEPLKGQEAVAQVVMNRVFSGFYPDNVCGVVYQNADRHLACQFTFACEGKDLSRIDEPDMWEQAKRIAKDTLDGKIWLADVGHATHYHAYWVHPSWVHEMKKMYSLGVHTFYRPRAWGDGSDAPVWGNVPATPKPAGAALENSDAAKEAVKEAAKEVAKEAAGAKSLDAAKGPQAAASPEPAARKSRG
jgi:spore germination cell wall hydrolase CwlJ-like protein